MTWLRAVNKRLFDLGIAVVLAPLAVVICLVCAIPVWAEARANPFFFQRRLGLNERMFSLLKIRTMSVGTVQAASHEVGHASVLRIGHSIRRFKIDELPQLWNVIVGDMSLVGPRPGLPVQTELTEARRAHHVFEMRPGITGPSQVAGLDMSTPWALAESDAAYLGRWDIRRDLRILWATVTGGGRGDAALRENDGNAR